MVKSCEHFDNGACRLNLYGGQPSPGVCRECPTNPTGGTWPVVGMIFVRPSPAVWGPPKWLALHAMADDSPTPAALAKRYATWAAGIPAIGCTCNANWQQITTKRPPDFSSPAAFRAWAWNAHNDERESKPRSFQQREQDI
jgi:hypothetical protein